MSTTVARLLVWVGADTKDAEAGLTGLSGGLQAFGSKATAAGKKLTTRLTLPLAAIGTIAVKSAAEYDTSMNLVEAVTEGTAEEMAALREEAFALGADLTLPATSAADAGEAMLELAKAGLTVQDVLDSTRGVLQLSAAGAISNADAARIAANALNAFNLEGSETVRVADVLAAGANSSSAQMMGLAEGLSYVSAQAASAGISIEETTAMIALLANRGMHGSRAGTGLAMMLRQLQAPTDKARESMDSLGLSIYDSTGTFRPMEDIIGQFQVALAGMTDEQRDAALSTIFTARSMRAARFIIDEGVDSFNNMTDAVSREEAAADLAAARMKGLGGAFEQFQSQVETALLAAVQPFQEDLIELIQWLARAIGSFADMPESQQKMIVYFGLAAAAAGPLLIVIGQMSTGVGALISVVSGIAGVGGSAISAFSGMASAATGMTAGIGTSLVALGAMAVAVAAVVAVYKTWQDQNDKIEEQIQRGKNAVYEAGQEYRNMIDSGSSLSSVLADISVKANVANDEWNSNIVTGTALGGVFNSHGKYLDLMGNQMDEANDLIRENTDSYEEYTAGVDAFNATIKDSNVHISALTKAEYDAQAGAISLSEGFVGVSQSITGTALAALDHLGITDELTEANEETAEAMDGVAEAADGATYGLEEVAAATMEAGDIVGYAKTAFEELGFSEEDVADKTLQLKVALGELSAEQANLQRDTELINEAFGAGLISWEQYVALMGQAKDGSLALTDALRGQWEQQMAILESQQAMMVSADELLGIYSASLSTAGDAVSEFAMSEDALAVSLGTTSKAQLQLRGDLELLSQGHAQGVVSANELLSAFQAAEAGTLSLSLAERSNISAALEQAAATREAAAAAVEAASAFVGMAMSMKDATEKQLAQAAIRELDQAMQDGKISSEDFMTAATDIGTTFGLMDEKSVALATGFDTLVGAMEEGVIPAENMAEALGALYEDAEDGVVNIGELIDAFKIEPIAEFHDSLKEKEEVWEGQIEKMDETEEGLGDLQTTLGETGTSVDEFGTGMYEQIGQMDAFDAGLQASQAELATTDEAASVAVSNISSTFTGANWHGVGASVGSGIERGIRSKIDSIARAAAAAVRAAMAAAKSEAGIASPAKAFEKEVGAPISAGIAAGIVGAQDRPAQAIEEVIPALLGQVAATTQVSEPTSIGVTLQVEQLNDSLDLEMLAFRIGEVLNERRKP